MKTRLCPVCGHENLQRAVFCFQCGASLRTETPVHGTPAQRRHPEEPMRTSQANVHDINAPEETVEASIICLRCSTPNQPLAHYCIGCGASLSVPEDFDPTYPVPRVSAISDRGRVRGNNEDRVGLWARQGVVLAVVADGMGGAAAGEEASRLVLEAIQAEFLGAMRGCETLRELSDEEVADKLRTTIRRANRAILERAEEYPAYQGMGTTVTLAFVHSPRVIIAHVGDSRAYLVNGQNGWINQVTDDHSFVEALLASGHITHEQAAVHPMRNVLYRALGQVEDVEADLYSRQLAEGDWLVLCSDGLTRHVKPFEIAQLATCGSTPAEAAQALIALANQRGGEDNISAVMIKMESAETLPRKLSLSAQPKNPSSEPADG